MITIFTSTQKYAYNKSIISEHIPIGHLSSWSLKKNVDCYSMKYSVIDTDVIQTIQKLFYIMKIIETVE